MCQKVYKLTIFVLGVFLPRVLGGFDFPLQLRCRDLLLPVRSAFLFAAVAPAGCLMSQRQLDGVLRMSVCCKRKDSCFP